MRGIGGSAGIAVVSWLFVRQTQIHFAELTAHVTPYNRDLVPYLSQHGLNALFAAVRRRWSRTKSRARRRCSPSTTCSGSSGW